VHQPFGSDNSPSKGLTYRLVSQANPQNWDFPRIHPDNLNGNARFVGRARSGRDDNVGRFKFADSFGRDGIVPENENFSPQLTEILDEVVGETVVVVNDHNSRHRFHLGKKFGAINQKLGLAATLLYPLAQLIPDHLANLFEPAKIAVAVVGLGGRCYQWSKTRS
jgi:hypothetical protein